MDTPMDIRLGLTSPEHLDQPLRWGLIGASSISSDWAKCLQEVPGAVVHAVAARSPEKAEHFRDQHGINRVHATYQELCLDPEVDVVYVGTITSLHRAHAMMGILAGKHVLCEKPLAENSADVAAMFEAAAEQGVMLLEGMWTRFFPAMEHARAAVETGTIGEVVSVHADFPDKCYALQAAPLAFGSGEMPECVVATGSGRVAAGVVKYAGGIATVSFPAWQSEFGEVIELTGTKGRITLDEWGHCPTRVTIRTCPPQCWDEPQGHTSTSQNGIQPEVESHRYPVPEPAGYPHSDWHYSNQHGFIYQAQAVHRCIVAGLLECPQYTKADSIAVMHIMDEIARQLN
eukprot:TRINITY_DN26804_c0_g2_i1.p1 TRINITY_DN26804_c0_g2~~TRINITY_DN26804_c0_g2_i1.p1  ORF type:complete len:345 (+),score=67.50 TRINITY_DN26804_c0_g2_i1:225-1259(+)